MNKALRIMLIAIGILAIAGGLIFAGTWIGRRTANGFGWPQSAYQMMNVGGRSDDGYDSGMMGNGNDMMGNYGSTNSLATPPTVDQVYQAAPIRGNIGHVEEIHARFQCALDERQADLAESELNDRICLFPGK